MSKICYKQDWRSSFIVFILVVINNTFPCLGAAICTKNQIYSERMKECAKEQKLADFGTLECFPIYSEEGCYQTKEETRWLVFEQTCALAVCVKKTDCAKEPQKCKQCDFNRGEVRQFNLQGEIECVCDSKLGMFRVGQNCYQQYSKGKCTGDGYVMVPDSTIGFKCIPSPCPKGCQWWPKDCRCKRVIDDNIIIAFTEPLTPALTSSTCFVDDGLLSEREKQCDDIFDIRSVVSNCQRDDNNVCMDIVYVPEVREVTEFDFDKILKDVASFIANNFPGR